MKKTLPFVLALVAFASCTNELEKVKKEGFQCSRAGGGAGFSATAGQHCFSCPDDTSMMKCGTNPLTSGCKEEPCKK